MKTVIVCLSLIVLSAFFYQHDAMAQTIYGTHINVDIPEYYLDPEWNGHLYPKYAKMYEAIFHDKNYPVWSPDSKWIVFTDGTYGIWKVSVNGGKPVLLYDNYDMHYWNGKPVTLTGLKPLCFTPDGSELTFVRNTINEEAGTEVEVDRDDNIIQIRYYYPVIESLNLETGKIRTIAESATSGCWSNDGRYFAYTFIIDLERPRPDLMVYDTETGNERSLNVTPGPPCFTMDDSHIIFTEEDEDDSFLYKISVDGGTPEQLTGFVDSNNYLVQGMYPDCSPDDEWIVFHGFVQYNKDDSYGNIELFVLNTYTGNITEIFPEENEPVIDPLKEVHE
ncbi:MAG: PD40 domain-containing protein, partial [Candidatus Latescibacteria bacterium]|nr:PD40 domain-containing protein [Candidatus Latescibacterota bacterium]